MLVIFVLSAVFAAQAQQTEFKTVISDEFHFIAFFPNRPIYAEGDINTRFGKGYSRRWTLELPDISYEVSVDDFSALSVKMNTKSLNSFYDGVCNDLGNQYGAKFGYYTSVVFNEYGRIADGGTKEMSVNVGMYLVRQRLYQVKIVMRNSLEKDRQTLADVDKFLNEFLFVQKKADENKYTYGLPQSVSQYLEGQ